MYFNEGTRPLSRCYCDKMKLILLKNTTGLHYNHYKINLIWETPILVVEHVLTTS